MGFIDTVTSNECETSSQPLGTIPIKPKML